MEKLTAKQQRVYDFICDTQARTGVPPTRAEIAQALGFASANAAQAHLRTLARKGAITLDSRRSRGIRLPDAQMPSEPGRDNDALPVIGRVAAGQPMLAVEHVDRHVRLPADLFSAPADYLLVVRGESMRDAGILDGDLLAVQARTEISDGRIGVFRIDDEVTVKRFRRDGRNVRLQAENPDYADIPVDAARDRLALEGVVVGVVRTI